MQKINRKSKKCILVFLFYVMAGLRFDAAYSDNKVFAPGLTGLIEEVKEKNPDILAAKKRWEASLAGVPQAKSLDNPNIGFTFEKIPKGRLKFDKTAAEDRMFSLTQMLPWFGKLPLKGKIAFVESQMSASEYKNTELKVINELKNGYYDLFMNYKEIELSGQSRVFLENIADTAQAKYVVGEVSQEELFKINLEIAKLSTAILNLRQENEVKQARINTLLNKQPDNLLAEPELWEEVSFVRDINSLAKLTLENQPELLMFAYAIEKNRYAESLAKKSFFPDLMAGLVQRGIASGGIGPWDLMVSFSAPFWFWTKQRYEVKEAIANLEEAQAAYQGMKNKALFETKDLAKKIEIAVNKINLYKSSLIPILESSIEVSLADFRSGKGDFMTFLDTQRMLIDTKMDYYKAVVEYNMNLADLERAVGGDLR